MEKLVAPEEEDDNDERHGILRGMASSGPPRSFIDEEASSPLSSPGRDRSASTPLYPLGLGEILELKRSSLGAYQLKQNGQRADNALLCGHRSSSAGLPDLPTVLETPPRPKVSPPGSRRSPSMSPPPEVPAGHSRARPSLAHLHPFVGVDRS